MYRSIADFCILILYHESSLNSLISSNVFKVVALGFSIYNIMPSANRESFTSFFPIWIPFIYFSCQISVAKTSSTKLNKSGEGGILGLFLTRGNAFSFSLLSVMLSVGLS